MLKKVLLIPLIMFYFTNSISQNSNINALSNQKHSFLQVGRTLATPDLSLKNKLSIRTAEYKSEFFLSQDSMQEQQKKYKMSDIESFNYLFTSFQHITINPNDGRIAFIAKNSIRGDTVPNVYILDPDGSYKSALSVVTMPKQLKKTLKKLYKSICWDKKGEFLYLFGQKYIYVFDLDQGIVTKGTKIGFKGKDIEHAPVDLSPIDESSLLYLIEDEIFTVDHRGKVIHRYSINQKKESIKNIFGGLSEVGKCKSVFNSKGLIKTMKIFEKYIYFDSILYNKHTGEKIIYISDAVGHFDLIEEKDLIFACGGKKIIIYDLQKNENIFKKEVEETIFGSAATKDLKLFSIKCRDLSKSTKRVSNEKDVVFDLILYSYEQGSMSEIKRISGINYLFSSESRIWFEQKNKITWIDRELRIIDSGLINPDRSEWLFYFNNSLLYDDLSGIDFTQREKDARNRNFNNLWQQ